MFYESTRKKNPLANSGGSLQSSYDARMGDYEHILVFFFNVITLHAGVLFPIKGEVHLDINWIIYKIRTMRETHY